MNDDRQAGRKEIGGGGEWTALRELKAKWLELADSAECYAEEAKRHSYPPEKIESHARTARTLKKCAADLEALAAAAPAPPAEPCLCVKRGEWRQECPEHGKNASPGTVTMPNGIVAHPPQDGQGAELLGPPRGGSSSDLADSGNPSVRARLQAIYDSHPYEHETTIEGYVRLQNQVGSVLESLPEAVAGNASAPVGEKRQPSGVGEPWPKRPFCANCLSSEWTIPAAREVGEGLRKALEHTAKLFHRHCAYISHTSPHAGVTFEDCMEVECVANRAALAAPAPKPAPPQLTDEEVADAIHGEASEVRWLPRSGGMIAVTDRLNKSIEGKA